MNGRNLLIPGLVSLLVSALLLTFLIFTTTPTTKQLPTRARPFVAFLGFLVSIAWISTLATEVVNVLKSIGVILSISDSLLGLTVFAVGNSLGDLVADVTVARLGYPVMALSACFGGPMLNILIGIGVARTISASREPYRISVSKSLLVSGAMLLATLLGLLIVVPLNGWRMDRKIGLGLVMLWCVSTLSNVIVEIFS
ncbi:sodium/calcium exchanger protein [Coccidioides immitis H538.4]|nr:sodium/calcium exchanger protein [Coccidioides immitis H538.4]